MRKNWVLTCLLACLALAPAMLLAGPTIDGVITSDEGWIPVGDDYKDREGTSSNWLVLGMRMYKACDENYAYVGFVADPIESTYDPLSYESFLGVLLSFADPLTPVRSNISHNCGGELQSTMAFVQQASINSWVDPPDVLNCGRGEVSSAPPNDGTFCGDPTMGCDPTACDITYQTLMPDNYVHLEMRWPKGRKFLETGLAIEQAYWNYSVISTPDGGSAGWNAGRTDCSWADNLQSPADAARYLVEDWLDPICGSPPAVMDIMPGSCPNTINARANATLEVALMHHDRFDVSLVDQATLRLEGVPPKRTVLVDEGAANMDQLSNPCACERLGKDGWPDISMQFNVGDIVAASADLQTADETTGEITLTLTGNLTDGTPFSARDCVIVFKTLNGNKVKGGNGKPKNR